MYQHTRLSDLSAIGTPGPLPDVIATWGDVPDHLADLTSRVDPQYGFDGTGFLPVDVVEPAFNPLAQALVPPDHCTSLDPATKRWAATATVRQLTRDEIAIVNPVPASVTNYQARRALRANKLFDKADAAVRGSGNPEWIDAWDYANEFLRVDDVIEAMGFALGLDSDAIDDLFRAAKRFP